MELGWGHATPPPEKRVLVERLRGSRGMKAVNYKGRLAGYGNTDKEWSSSSAWSRSVRILFTHRRAVRALARN